MTFCTLIGIAHAIAYLIFSTAYEFGLFHSTPLMPTSVCKEFPKPNHFVSLKECVGCGCGIPSTEENVDPTQCVLAIFKISFGPVPTKPNQNNVDQYPYAHYSMHPKIKMIKAVPG